MENDPVIWRCLSYKPISAGMTGFHNQVMFDDMVATERLQKYFETLEERGIEKVTVKRLGTLSYVMENGAKLGFDKVRSGADRMARENKLHKLEDFIGS